MMIVAQLKYFLLILNLLTKHISYQLTIIINNKINCLFHAQKKVMLKYLTRLNFNNFYKFINQEKKHHVLTFKVTLPYVGLKTKSTSMTVSNKTQKTSTT